MWDNIITSFRNMYVEFRGTGRYGEKTFSVLLKSFYELCMAMNFSSNYKKTDECHDVINSVIEGLLKQLAEGKYKFWEETLEINEENNTRIKSYVYKSIQNEMMRGDEFNGIKNNFRRHIERALENLINEKKLVKNEKGKYYLHNFENNYTENCSEIEVDYIGNIYNKNGTINNESVQEIILKLFENYLENCAVSSSYIKRVISEIVYPVIIPSIDSMERTMGNDGDDAEVELKDTIKDPDETITQNVETEQLTDIWIDRAKEFYKNERDFRRDARLFLGKFYENKTLRELENMFKIKKSTIDNYIKRFKAALEIHKDIGSQDWGKYKDVFEYKLAREIGAILED